MGLRGGLNQYGFASGDPINNDDPLGLRPLSKREREDLGDFCNTVDCDKVDVQDGTGTEAENKERDRWVARAGGTSITLGNTIYLAERHKGDVATLAHEMTHVYQFQTVFKEHLLVYSAILFSSEQVPRWLLDQTRGRIGYDPYEIGTIDQDPRPFKAYPYEGQASIVGTCFDAGNVRQRAACVKSPFKPGGAP